MSNLDRQEVGRTGEDIACKFLVKRGFQIKDQNYRKKWGEIDIIAKKGKVLHFVEVKTVTRENLSDISCVTDGYRPEDNVHPWKLQRLSRTIQTYLLDKNYDDVEWVFDVATVYLVLRDKKAKVQLLENIIL